LQLVEDLGKQSESYGKQVSKIATDLQTTKTFAVELQNQLMQQGGQALTTFFDDIGTGSKSAQQAFADLGKSFEQMIVHMIDQMIIYYTLMALVGWVAPNSSFYASLQKPGPFGGLLGHADGGYTGNVSPNRVAGVVHGQEFVLSAGATRRWGLPLLEAMNAGTVGSVATPGSFSGYGGGSAANAAAAGGGPLVEINIDSGGQPVSQKQRQGPGGKSILDLVVGKVASDISSGGPVGQSIQSTFGVSRRGVRRG